MSDDLVFVSLVAGIPEPPTWWVCDAPHMTFVPSPMVPAGRVWLVDQWSCFALVPAAERWAARAVMRCGQSVAVRGYDSRAVACVAGGLHRLFALDGDGGWCGHA